VKAFTLQLLDATRSRQIPGVTAFVGEDNSGSFGILANHARLMTSLIMGLARFRSHNGPWQYLAMPGGLLYFHNNLLTLSTRHYLLDDDYSRISNAMQQQLLAEEQKLHTIKASLRHLEEEAVRRLWRLGRTGA
jgi:F-type H+-transporting ATPase subunit epsilon